MSELHGVPGRYRVAPRSEHLEPLRDREFEFRVGPVIGLHESVTRAGELAMIPVDPVYPEDAPLWIASGDLVLVAEKTYPKPPAPGQLELGDTP
jgi:hypothetical protein